MQCSNPYIKAGHAFGCGQCMSCRINRRRVWTHRIMLEALEHDDNGFLTLTYRDECLPDNGLVEPRALQLFLKRLRKYYDGRIRFYGVGEYGEVSGRPHYHLALFGYPGCEVGSTQKRKECCVPCEGIKKCWSEGNIVLGSLTTESAAYIAGYVTKTSEKGSGSERKPFARMSNRPGIGAGAMDDVASALLEANYKGSDVPAVIMHGQRQLPLGRYLRRRLRCRMGMDEGAPQETLDAMATAMRPMYEKARSYAPRGHVGFSFKQEVIEAGTQGRHKQDFWQKVRTQRRRIV